MPSHISNETPAALTSPDRALRLIEDFQDILENIKQLAEFGMVEHAVSDRIERDLRSVVNACFARTLN